MFVKKNNISIKKKVSVAKVNRRAEENELTTVSVSILKNIKIFKKEDP